VALLQTLMAVDYQPWFNHFVGAVLPLDETRVERIEDAWRHLQGFVAGDTAFRGLRPQIVPQGSYAAGTAIRPLRKSDEFDVDLVIKLTLRRSVTSTAVLDWLRGRLAMDQTFRRRLVPHPRCVRVNYAGDFHFDIVPARRVSTLRQVSPATTVNLVRLKVPDRKGGWRFSNPEGFVNWCRKQDRRTGGDFGRMVMMLKRWRDNRAPEKARVRSIVFTTLIGRAVPTWHGATESPRPDARVLVATLQRLNRQLRPITAVLFVRNPSLASENLARSWTRSDFLEFRGQINEAWKLATEIYRSGDPARWRAFFGKSFPLTPW
jgi:hypothetical protein